MPLVESVEALGWIKTMYGTEDSAAVCQDTWTNHVTEKGVQMGIVSSALFAGSWL